MAIALPRYLNYGNPIDRANPLMRGLVSRWKVVPYYSSGGRLIDLAGKNHGVLTNGAAFASAAGRPGGSGSLDLTAASTQYALVNSGLGLTAFPVTFGLWVKLKGTASEYALVQIANSADDTNRLVLSTPPARGWELQVKNSAVGFDTDGFSVASGGTLDTNWHRIIGVAESSTSIKLYIDGVLLGSDVHTTGFPTGLNKVGIGYEVDSAPARPANAYADDVFVSTRLYTANDVSEDYKATRSQYDPTLNWYSHPVMMGADAAPPSGNPWNYYAQL